VRVANVDMAKAWDGPEGAQWSAHVDRYERTSRLHWARFLAEVSIERTAQVLDVGCGNGRSSCDVAAIAADGSVLGVDLSSQMLARARSRAQRDGLNNVTFEQADAQVYEFEPASRDLVISTFGIMFFADPVAAFANIRKALRPGGRLAALVWQGLDGNEWMTVVRNALAMGRELPAPPPGAPGPIALADPQRVEQLLTAAGFEGVALSSIEAPVDFGADADEAFDFVRSLGMARALLQDLDDATAAAGLAELRAALAAHETDDGVLFGAASWLVTAVNPT
jgi:SAM-dependent methyltransferase